tara:strand:- start:111 stop:329 length:219 start_codon:yes stop_codon:yes gene_type:complete
LKNPSYADHFPALLGNRSFSKSDEMGRMSKMLSEFKGSFNDDSCTLITNPELLTNIDLEKHYDYELDEILNE